MGKRLCLEKVVSVNGRTWVCIRPAHDAGHVHVDNYRREHGLTVKADRHVFVRRASDG